jgi:LmbE family N-acetylglucosaminyl deacetylase
VPPEWYGRCAVTENSPVSESLKTETFDNADGPFEHLAQRIERVVCICARPGDEVLFAGASLHRMSTRGTRVTLVALSSRAATLPPALRSSVIVVPTQGLRRAAEVLGAARVEQLAMSSPPLGAGERIALQERLCQLIREEQPDLVISEGLGVPSAAVDRRAGVALSDGAIAAAAASAFGKRPSDALPPYEISERWLFAPPSDVAIYRRRSEEADRLNRQTWVTVDAGADFDAKWLALSAYLADLPERPTPALERLLRTERFLAIRYVGPALLSDHGTRGHKATPN